MHGSMNVKFGVLLFIFTGYTFRMVGYVWMVTFGLVKKAVISHLKI